MTGTPTKILSAKTAFVGSPIAYSMKAHLRKKQIVNHSQKNNLAHATIVVTSLASQTQAKANKESKYSISSLQAYSAELIW